MQSGNIVLTSEEYKILIEKHGRITYKEICRLKGIEPEKDGKVFRKPPSNKNVEEIKLLLRLAGIAYVEEYKFHPTRKWRFDIAIPEHKLAIEYEGIFGGKSRHTTVKGFSTDCSKYNAGSALGWTVLRYTAKNFTNVVSDVEKFFKNKVT